MTPEEEMARGRSTMSVVAAAHETTRQSKQKGEGWRVCELSLENLRRVAVFADRRWL